MSNQPQNSAQSIYRPRQVLLVGLGGVGSRIADRIMGMVPEEYLPYTQAISIDTDVNEIGVLSNIPLKNRIRIGEGVTIGSYTRLHPEIKDWMITGKQMDLVRGRNTSQGAKQIRLVSRIALRATNTEGNLGQRIVRIVDEAKKADGKLDGSGLLVMVVCSVAGGTGAGTVLQVPIYLEEAIKTAYTSSDVEFECAMLMPNAFASTLSPINLNNAKTNSYAVMRELMSLNNGSMRRFEFFDPNEVDRADQRCAPYGRVYLFDNKTSDGESIPGNVDEVHVPLVADALYEYLFGPGHGKIASALDNTLAEVYATNGEAIFGAIGKAALVFPRSLYQQYSLCRWIDATLSDTWLAPDEQAKESYREAVRKAREQGEKKPAEDTKYDHYNRYIDTPDENSSSFRNAIRRQVMPCPYNRNIHPLPYDDINEKEEREKGSQFLSVGQWFFRRLCDRFDEMHIQSDEELLGYADSYIMTDDDYQRGNRETYIKAVGTLHDKYNEKRKLISGFVKAAMHPSEAKKDEYYDSKKTGHGIYYYIRDKHFHPIAIRYFLYDLYKLLKETANLDVTIENPRDELPASEWERTFKGSKKNRNSRLSDYVDQIESSAYTVYKTLIAQALLPEIEEMIHEIEDLFLDILKVKEFFSEGAENTLKTIEKLNDQPDTILAGSTLSARNCWKLLERTIHDGEQGEDDLIDEKMSSELCQIVYKSYLKHTERDKSMTVKENGQNIRVRTQYASLLRNTLLQHFSNQLNHEFSNIFPSNVVEAVIEDCRIRNCWLVTKNDNPHLHVENFICTNIVDNEYAELARQAGLSPVNAAEELNVLLSRAIGKSEPRCGLVEQAADDNFNNRLMVMNEEILPVISENDKDTGELISRHDRTRIIDGVNTNDILGTSINPFFGGESVDEIVLLTVYSGLSPDAFVGFHAPDDDKDDPTDGMDYYIQYRNYISEMVNDPNLITPHLDKNWHLSEKLVDITIDHTRSVQRHAARAFVYGFIYDLISVKKNGSVEYGDGVSTEFKAIDPEGYIERLYIQPSEQADLADNTLTSAQQVEKLNAILFSVFKELIENRDLRAAIIEHTEERLSEEKRLGLFSFTDNADLNEPIANMHYNNILDVLDGYFQGCVRAPHNNERYAIESTQYMFNVLLHGIYDQVRSVSAQGDPDVIKKAYCQIIDVLYDHAVCDDPLTAPSSTQSSTGTPAPAGTTPGQPAAPAPSIKDIMQKTAATVKTTETKPFTDGGRFSRGNAKKAVSYMLDNTQRDV